jgi:hypothetical protein
MEVNCYFEKRRYSNVYLFEMKTERATLALIFVVKA